MARSAAQRVLHTAVLLPLLVFAVSNLRSVAFLCSMTGDGVLRADCCCPQDADQHDDDGPRVAAASCCELRHLAMARPPSEPPRAAGSLALALPAVAASPLLLPPVPSAPPVPGWVRAWSPPPGPSLLLLKQTLLI